MQDGAPVHIGRNVRTWTRRYFEEREIGRYGNIYWPAPSPDLTLMDFFVWAWVKEHFYRQPVNTLSELKECISKTMHEMPVDFVEHSLLSFKSRLQTCIERRGLHVE